MTTIYTKLFEYRAFLGTKNAHRSNLKFLLGKRSKTYIFDLKKTLFSLVRALLFTYQIIKKRGSILIINTNPEYSFILDTLLNQSSNTRFPQQSQKHLNSLSLSRKSGGLRFAQSNISGGSRVARSKVSSKINIAEKLYSRWTRIIHTSNSSTISYSDLKWIGGLLTNWKLYYGLVVSLNFAIKSVSTPTDGEKAQPNDCAKRNPPEITPQLLFDKNYQQLINSLFGFRLYVLQQLSSMVSYSMGRNEIICHATAAYQTKSHSNRLREAQSPKSGRLNQSSESERTASERSKRSPQLSAARSPQSINFGDFASLNFAKKNFHNFNQMSFGVLPRKNVSNPIALCAIPPMHSEMKTKSKSSKARFPRLSEAKFPRLSEAKSPRSSKSSKARFPKSSEAKFPTTRSPTFLNAMSSLKKLQEGQSKVVHNLQYYSDLTGKDVNCAKRNFSKQQTIIFNENKKNIENEKKSQSSIARMSEARSPRSIDRTKSSLFLVNKLINKHLLNSYIKTIDLVIVLNPEKNHYALNEARILQVPVIAFVDASANATKCTFPIYGNEDSIPMLYLFFNFLKKMLNKKHQSMAN